MIYNAKKLRLAIFVLNFAAILPFGNAVQAEAVQLTPRNHEGSFSRVKTVVEMAGSLAVDNPAAKDGDSKQLEIPLKVDAEMFFDEKGLAGKYAPTLRHYWEAKADFEVAKGKDHRELREERPLILLSQGISANERYTSPYGPLRREEIELIDVACV